MFVSVLARCLLDILQEIASFCERTMPCVYSCVFVRGQSDCDRGGLLVGIKEQSSGGGDEHCTSSCRSVSGDVVNRQDITDRRPFCSVSGVQQSSHACLGLSLGALLNVSVLIIAVRSRDSLLVSSLYELWSYFLCLFLNMSPLYSGSRFHFLGTDVRVLLVSLANLREIRRNFRYFLLAQYSENVKISSKFGKSSSNNDKKV